MEQLIRRGIAITEEQAPDTIGSMLHFELESCDAQRQEATFLCETAGWMGNVLGTLHGGISAVIIDHAMGILSNSLRQGWEKGPTIQLNLTYHKPLLAGERVRVRVQVVSASKCLTQMYAEAHSVARGTLCTSATGTYYFKSKE